ncbi:hypothetical protein HID58_090608 [Brassica napus]|uniref:Uncharacterized protein n=2 Tax=Brassica napus TaxID=3708 RepID=A0ABQ7XDR2_BRANA|nr:hypothetical protein HID58_090608 [Brassica napus]
MNNIHNQLHYESSKFKGRVKSNNIYGQVVSVICCIGESKLCGKKKASLEMNINSAVEILIIRKAVSTTFDGVSKMLKRCVMDFEEAAVACDPSQRLTNFLTPSPVIGCDSGSQSLCSPTYVLRFNGTDRSCGGGEAERGREFAPRSPLFMDEIEIHKPFPNRQALNLRLQAWKTRRRKHRLFQAYYVRLKLQKQIVCFNHLLDHQYHLMNYPPKIPLAPMPNGIHHPMPPVGMQIGYPVLQHPQMHVQGHHTHIAAATAMSSCHVVVNGVPAPPHLQPFIEDELNQ